MRKLLLTLLFAGFTIIVAAQPYCLYNLQYRLPITISNSLGTLSNFQVKLVMNTATLVSSGKMNSAGNDIRFTDGNCNDIPYYIESGMNTSSTIIWIKPSTLVNGNNSIYMYYSDPRNIYGSASNASAVFDFFDDFNGSGLSSAWSTEFSSGTITVSGGTVNFSCSGYANILSTATYNSPVYTEMKVNSASGNWPHITQYSNGGGQIGPLLNGTSLMQYGYVTSSSTGRGSNWYGGATPGTITGIWSIGWNATNDAKLSWPGGSYSYTTTPTKPSAVNIALGGLASGSMSMSVDWARVRKYATTDPTVSFGTEVLNYDMDGVNLLDYYTSTTRTTFCGGDQVYFNSKFWLQLGLSGAMYVELSDGSGSFSSPTTIGSYTGLTNYGYNSSSPFAWFSFAIPNNLPYGTGYRVRWRLVDKAYNGAPTSAFTIGAFPTSTNFTVNNAAQCDEEDLFTFTALGSIASSNTLSRDWKYGDGNTDAGSPVSHSYSTYGTYNVSLKAYNKDLPKCSTDIIKAVVVYPQPAAVINDYSWNNCPKADQYFDGYASNVATGSLSSYSWDFGDGGTGSSSFVNHVYSNFGNYTVNLVVTSDKGCKDTATVTHTVYPLPVVNFTTELACDGHDVQFKDLTTLNSFGGSSLSGGYYYYRFDDGSEAYDKNPKHLYSSTGTYSVFLQVQTNKYCSDTIRKKIVVNPSPKAQFQASNACLSDNVTLLNQSSISSGTNSYKWDFGNGANSSATTPSPLYSQPGSYNIKLKATSNTGCTDSTNKDILIYSMPVAQFSATDECLGTPTSFTNFSVDAVSSKWTFENGQTSVAENPSYTYNTDGSKSVTLEVSTANGCKNSTTKSVAVWPIPTATFTAISASSCLNLHNFSLTNNSTVSSGSFTSNWEFGDNTVSSATSPQKKYAGAGTYTIVLNTTSDKGCMNSSNKTVIVNPHPIVDFSFTNNCIGSAIPFTNKSNISSGTINNYDWNFGDANTSNSINPSHTYSIANTYTVSLQATSNAGCIANTSYPVVAWPLPVVSFTNDDVCFGLSNKFTNTSGVSSGFMATYEWSFGDASSSDEISPSHNYTTAGAYMVSLKGTSDKGCSANASGTANVWPQPVANFTTSDVCQGLASSFTNTSTLTGGTISNYNWNFGDGNGSTNQNPTHTYATFGNYLVNLKVSSDKNCSSSISKEAKVYRQPSARIYASTVQTSVLDPVINFSDNSLFGDYSDWDFGFNNRTSNNNLDTCSYFKPGRYIVRLISSTVNQCSDDDSVVIQIENGYTIYFPNTFTPNGDNLNDAFGPVGIFEGITSYSLNILDNRGRVLFNTTDLHKKWTGKPDGSEELVPAGNYTWFAEYTDFKGSKHSVNGVISIRQ